MKIINKNKVLLIGLILFILGQVGVNYLIYKNQNDASINKSQLKDLEDKKDTFAIMLEQNDGSYQLTTSKSFNQPGYIFSSEKSICYNANGDIIANALSYNNATKSVNLTIKGPAHCYVYFDKKPTAVDELLQLASADEIAFDGTADNNLRYIGKNPNNYIYFNCNDYNNPTASTCEKWRIIGAFNNVENAANVKRTLFKIVRNESIGKFIYDWKTAGVGSAKRGSGSYDWSDSQLMLMLNGISTRTFKSGYTVSGDYLLDTNGVSIMNISGSYYDGSSVVYKPSFATPSNGFEGTVTVDFSSIGIKNATTRGMIEYALWKLGHGNPDETTSSLYDSERSAKVYSGQPVEWPNYIGLMYPSDYGFATGGGATTSRATCLSTIVYDWRDSSSDCYINNWLTPTSREHLITPWGYSPSSSSPVTFLLFSITDDGLLRIPTAGGGEVFPTLYLKPNIVINGGTGTSANPYTIKMS